MMTINALCYKFPANLVDQISNNVSALEELKLFTNHKSGAYLFILLACMAISV